MPHALHATECVYKILKMKTKRTIFIKLAMAHVLLFFSLIQSHSFLIFLHLKTNKIRCSLTMSVFIFRWFFFFLFSYIWKSSWDRHLVGWNTNIAMKMCGAPIEIMKKDKQMNAICISHPSTWSYYEN